MNLKVFFLSILLSSSLFVSYAQTDSTKIHQKMDQLFTAMEMESIYTAGVNTSLEQALLSNIELAKYKDEMRDYYSKYLAWPLVKSDMEKLYLRYYATGELDDLIKFYNTPAGKKTVKYSGNMQREIQAMQQTKLQANVDELNKVIKAKTSNNE